MVIELNIIRQKSNIRDQDKQSQELTTLILPKHTSCMFYVFAKT